MNEKRKQRKQKKHATMGEPYLVTRAVTHIRLVEVNPGKLAALDALAPVYLALCQHYVTLFCTQERPNKVRDPLYATLLSERWHRVAIMQAAGIAQAWRSNRAAASQQYQDDLAQYRKRQEEGTVAASAKEPRWREWHVPTLREPCLQANVNVVKLEVSRDSTYDYWLSISTLGKGHPIQVPVKLAQYHKEQLTDPKTGQPRKLNSSVQLNKRDGVWWLTLSYDEEVTIQTPSDAPVVGIDVGIASATRSRVHNRFIRLSRRSEAYCSTSSTLERRSGKATNRCRSPLTTFLNHPIADRTVREHQCLLASERIGS